MFAADNPINNNMKLQHILEAKYHGNKGQVELTQVPEDKAAKKAFDKAVNEAWPEVTYRGENVFKMFYEDELDRHLQKELFEELKEHHDIRSIDGQESYLGYVPEEDFFVMGWDLWAEVKNDWHNWQEDEDDEYGEEEYYQEESIENMMVCKIEQGGPEEWYMLDIPAGRMYPNGIKALHDKYPGTVDVRLD